ncbi:hypothetical protein Asi03nite_04570 [Actinoplanes siamensis]|uniref:Uncharacterized protein n=1 Tax=Actinoplanes siamensis TaxID=1223317 RepID=A0A919KCG1_9ACTN|nr:hypothetical protein Asi03nite_04570 [Actinoplanes siamensis]
MRGSILDDRQVMPEPVHRVPQIRRQRLVQIGHALGPRPSSVGVHGVQCAASCRTPPLWSVHGAPPEANPFGTEPAAPPSGPAACAGPRDVRLSAAIPCVLIGEARIAAARVGLVPGEDACGVGKPPIGAGARVGLVPGGDACGVEKPPIGAGERSVGPGIRGG